MSFLWIILGGICLFGLAGVIAAFAMLASPDPAIAAPRDVFGFATLADRKPERDLPHLRRYPSRDGEELAYRFYDAPAERILIFAHGSSYHGGGYHALAAALSGAGAAKVVLPNLRGHFQSGRRRGDVDYVGQLEDDLADLISFLRGQGLEGPITLGGHSSGGGLAIRFAGGAHAPIVSNYLLLSPFIPASPAIRDATGGGWAVLNMRRLYGFLALTALGIHGFDALPTIAFNKPARFWDGTETLSYSHRLNVSYHPRYRYANDVRRLGGKTLVLIGADDEAIDPAALQAIITASAPHANFAILPDITHFGIFSAPSALRTITEWVSSL